MKLKTYILSGGKSSRMGQDKGLQPILGKPAIAYLLDMLQPLGITPVIIAHAGGYSQFGVRVIGDVIPGKGPMGGIYTALSDAAEDVLILAADAPFISTAVMRALLAQQEEGQINVIRYNGRVQPLCGIYPAVCAGEVKESVQSSRLKMMDLLDRFPTHYIGLEGIAEIFHNNNTPADHAAAVNYLRKMNIKCFGKLTDIITGPAVPAYPTTVQAFKDHLQKAYPALATVEYKIALNRQIVTDPGTNICEADEIALLPAFSGG